MRTALIFLVLAAAFFSLSAALSQPQLEWLTVNFADRIVGELDSRWGEFGRTSLKGRFQTLEFPTPVYVTRLRLRYYVMAWPGEPDGTQGVGMFAVHLQPDDEATIDWTTKPPTRHDVLLWDQVPFTETAPGHAQYDLKLDKPVLTKLLYFKTAMFNVANWGGIHSPGEKVIQMEIVGEVFYFNQ